MGRPHVMGATAPGSWLQVASGLLGRSFGYLPQQLLNLGFQSLDFRVNRSQRPRRCVLVEVTGKWDFVPDLRLIPVHPGVLNEGQYLGGYVIAYSRPVLH